MITLSQVFNFVASQSDQEPAIEVVIQTAIVRPGTPAEKLAPFFRPARVNVRGKVPTAEMMRAAFKKANRMFVVEGCLGEVGEKQLCFMVRDRGRETIFQAAENIGSADLLLFVD